MNTPPRRSPVNKKFSASCTSKVFEKHFKYSLATVLFLASFPVFSDVLVLSPNTTTPITPSCENGVCRFDLKTNPLKNITSIIQDRSDSVVHEDYLIELPNSGFTINNTEENAAGWLAGIDFAEEAKNGFSVTFDGDVTINKTGLLMESEGGAVFNFVGNSVSDNNEPGPFVFKKNLTINLGSQDKGVKTEYYTAALNVGSGDFSVDGNTTISVQKLLNVDNQDLFFSGITLGGGYDLPDIADRKYRFNDIKVEYIYAEGNQGIVNSSEISGIHINKNSPGGDVNRIVSVNNILINSVKLKVENSLPALVRGIFNNGGEFKVSNGLHFQDITVDGKGISIAKAMENLHEGKISIQKELLVNGISAKGEEIVNAFGIYSEIDGSEVNIDAPATISDISAIEKEQAQVPAEEILASGLITYEGTINLGKTTSIENITADGAGSMAVGIYVYPGMVTAGDGLTIRGIQGETGYSLSAINDSVTDEAVITATNATIVEGDVSSVREPGYTDGKGSEINLGFVGKIKVMVGDEEKEIYKYLKGFSTVDDVSTFNLNLEDGAYWEVVTSNPAIQPEEGSYKSIVTKLSLNGGKVYVGSTEKGWEDGIKFADSLASLVDTDRPVQLTIQDLSGNGEFYLRTNADDVSDSIVITNSLSGNFILNVQPTGEKPPERQEQSYLAKALDGVAVGDKVFKLGGGKEINGEPVIDIGVYVYKLDNSEREQDGSTEWYLVRTDKPQEPDEPPLNPDTPEMPDLPVYSPTAEAVLAMAGMGAQSGFYQNQLTDVRKRLGEIRSGVRDGLWASVAGQKDRLTGFAGTNFKQDVYRFNFGVDAVVGDWILGGNFKYINADQKTRDTFFKAKGDAHSEGFNLYATWQNDKGCYADFILSADRYHQKINNTMLDGTGVKGTYRNLGLGVSAEVGKKFILDKEENWFAEPQLQLSYYHVRGDDFTMSNGMKVRQGNFNSLTGRLGVATGYEVKDPEGKPKGQVYLRTGLKHEFLGKQTLHVNDVKFRDKLVGTRAYYGLATDWNLSKNLKVYGHVERENGSHYTKEIEVMAGVKFSF